LSRSPAELGGRYGVRQHEITITHLAPRGTLPYLECSHKGRLLRCRNSNRFPGKARTFSRDCTARASGCLAQSSTRMVLTPS
jgi:hypothetical protein